MGAIILEGEDTFELEEKINEFLKNIEPENLVSISYSGGNMGFQGPSVLIVIK